MLTYVSEYAFMQQLRGTAAQATASPDLLELAPEIVNNARNAMMARQHAATPSLPDIHQAVGSTPSQRHQSTSKQNSANDDRPDIIACACGCAEVFFHEQLPNKADLPDDIVEHIEKHGNPSLFSLENSPLKVKEFREEWIESKLIRSVRTWCPDCRKLVISSTKGTVSEMTANMARHQRNACEKRLSNGPRFSCDVLGCKRTFGRHDSVALHKKRTHKDLFPVNSNLTL
jgi:hypothetical protein